MGGEARRTVALAAMALLGACRTFDDGVFDERLRRATFDAYVETIETQFGGLDAAAVSAAELRDRYRSAALEAPTPAAFYGVLRALLADLDDPHAVLQVSPRFWVGPVAEPEWIQFARDLGGVAVGVPAPSLRTLTEALRARDRWLAELDATELHELDTLGIARLLRRSAAFGPRFAGDEFDRTAALSEPLVWMRLVAVDGRPVETPHDAELLVRGALGSIARLDVELEGGEGAVLGLLRNAGVFENDEAPTGVRRRLHPLELADQLDPEGALTHGHRPWARAPRAVLRARRLAIRRSSIPRARRLMLPEELADPFGLEALLLETPGGREVAFLRIGTFRARTEEGARRGEGSPTLMAPLELVAHAFRGVEHWVVDVTANPGGSWAEAGLFMSYFQDPSEEVVPHEVRSITESGTFLLRTRIQQIHRLRRVEVEPLHPRSVHVLVDQDTASAGEIVASFLRGAAGAVLVGERTAGAEFSTGEFRAPDGSLLRIGLGGGMMAPYEGFQGRGLAPDLDVVRPSTTRDIEAWRAVLPLECLAVALEHIDRVEGP